jgi:hypothetical protein
MVSSVFELLKYRHLDASLILEPQAAISES